VIVGANGTALGMGEVDGVLLYIGTLIGVSRRKDGLNGVVLTIDTFSGGVLMMGVFGGVESTIEVVMSVIEDFVFFKLINGKRESLVLFSF
jgi:hypothetical protein